jgi:hypothetical protein
MAFCKKLQLRRLLTVFVACVLLIASTACSGGANAQGANPDNPAVQAGGGNNPYKSGGDSYTNLKMPTEAQQNKTSLEPSFQQLIAANKDSGMLYTGAETPAGRAKKEAELPVKTAKDYQQPEPGGLNQRNSNLGERIENRVEAVKETFKDASGFIQDKAEESTKRPDSLQRNPVLKK